MSAIEWTAAAKYNKWSRT